MNRITVEIYVPAVRKTFDVEIPGTLPLFQLRELTARLLSGLSGGLFQAGEEAALCDRLTGKVYDINVSARELGIRNGSRLMLI